MSARRNLDRIDHDRRRPTPSPTRTRPRAVTALLVALGLAAGALTACSDDVARNAAAELPPSVSVTAAVVEVQSVSTPTLWKPVDLVYEGSPARVTLTLDAVGAPASATLMARLEGTGRTVGSTPIALQSGTQTARLPLDLRTGAWTGTGVANAASALTVTVTTSTGLTVTSTVPLTVAPRPVVMLHGLWSDAGTWSSYGGFLSARHPAWRGFAVGDGAYPGRMNTGALLDPLGRPNTVEQNMNEAWTYITALRSSLDAHQVDIVAHSMGGIISRRLLHAKGRAAQDAIRTIVMLGTPNGGSGCASVWAVPATEPLRPAVMATFNTANPGYPGVYSTLAYAEHLPLTCLEFAWGDSVVPRWSAKAQPVNRFEISAPTLHSNMTSDLTMFNRHVVPVLAVSIAPSETAPTAATTAPPAEALIDNLLTGELLPGTPLDQSITVEIGQSLVASVVTGEGGTFDIVYPDGRIEPLTLQDGLPVLAIRLPAFAAATTVRLVGTAPGRAEWSLGTTT